MVERLIGILAALGYPVYRQGSLTEAYPATFITFWNPGTEGTAYYDNSAGAVIWDFIVSLYSTDPALVEAKLAEAADKLREAGFIASGKGFDVASDEVTHTGRAIDIQFIERKEASWQ
jgi:hypothetical protein